MDQNKPETSDATGSTRQRTHPKNKSPLSDAKLLLISGTTALAEGHTDKGKKLLRLADRLDDKSAALIELSNHLRKKGNHAEANRLYSRALTKDPSNFKAQNVADFVNSGIRQSVTPDWSALWSGIRSYETNRRTSPINDRTTRDHLDRTFTNAPERDMIPEAFESVLTHKDSPGAFSAPFLRLISMRALLLGYFRDGFRLRQMHAARVLQDAGSRGIFDQKTASSVFGALCYLGDFDLARVSIEMLRDAAPPKIRKSYLGKVAGELSLLEGDLGAFSSWGEREASSINLNSNFKFRDLVQGRSVAIVGPSASEDGLGESIDNHDVIIRPRLTPEFSESINTKESGSRTDITYYSHSGVSEYLEYAEDLVNQGKLQLAVAPHAGIKALEGEVPTWLRPGSYFNSCYLNGSPLTIPRITADVLAHSPSSVSIFGTDFYTGSRSHSAGYRPERQTSQGEGRVLGMVITKHDLLLDFRLLTRLTASGPVSAFGPAAEVLRLSEQEYLHRIETTGPLSDTMWRLQIQQ